jgi:DNA-binding NarL/FixJ family response regulator
VKNIIILEDHPDVQQWVIQLCKRVFPEAHLTVTSTISEATALKDQAVDLVLVDLNLPDGRGDSVIHHFKILNPSIQCIVLTSFDDDEYLFSALKAGATGYLLKDQNEDELINMLQGILSGKPALSPLVAIKLMKQFRLENESKESMLLELTPREHEALKMIARGYSVKESAKLMNISHHTVSGYIKEIYRKLHVNSRAEAAALATRMGLN